ncbi:hypothetical protein [Streptosporangium roseum]|uniref:DUF1616 domain-containing protein n=1 Tax=Streptosporangium roseum (strain ATCC 12428 / DSM 43021 / JCM 3005 / KCTC 9067 / NCIMB 10171 / NRRL 2505 / NI 9100) TaxID=479432 RepID=D2ARI6_STRRD|nr:hypothetical protein [Streptosporangium roseum]ACZ90326.1 hypothetical protein Sros_7653 [Streptosporangium roseum DSM 43021]
MPKDREVLKWALILACATGAVVALADLSSPLRMIFTPLFLLAVPGVAAAGLLRDRDPLTAISVGVTVSLLANVLLATAMLSFESWSPRAGVATIAVLGGFTYVLRLLQRGSGSLRTEQGAGSG